jgi:hypothetical protein
MEQQRDPDEKDAGDDLLPPTPRRSHRSAATSSLVSNVGVLVVAPSDSITRVIDDVEGQDGEDDRADRIPEGLCPALGTRPGARP